MTRTVAVVSDTHRQLRWQLLESIADVELIVHAGDIGSASVIEGLSSIAPTIAIRGNIDSEPWADNYPESRTTELLGLRALLVHDVNTLDAQTNIKDIDLVVSGHSHKPQFSRRDGVCYLNPGSVGPRRFRLPIAFVRLELKVPDPGRAQPPTVSCRFLELADNDAVSFEVVDEQLIELNGSG